MVELHELPALTQRELLTQGVISPVELTEHYLERIELLNPRIQAFTTVTPERAMDRARQLEDASRDRGRPSRRDSPLWGMPFADKDLNDRAGVTSTYGSRLTADYVAGESSPIVIEMDEAGGVSLGKTNVPEFGFPAYGENLLPQGSPRNPWDVTRDPGGSSSGAAAAVAARMLPFAPGNDAGGSIRIPASACGLVGLKPTRGRVPGESGIASLAGLAVGGPLGRSVGDIALLLDGMVSGPNRYALRAPDDLGLPASGSYVDSLEDTHRSLRIGWNVWSPWSTNYEIEVDRQVNQVFEDTLSAAAELGHEVEHIDPSPTPTYFESFRTVWMASAASLPFPDAALDALEPLTAWLVRKGRTRPAADLPGALAALKQFEAQIIADYLHYDLILTPLLAMTPRPIGWFDASDGERNFMQQCQFTPFTSYVNVAGLPALSMPVGMSAGVSGSESPLPIGVQAIGRSGQESTLLRFALDMEKRFGWDTRVPPVVSGV